MANRIINIPLSYSRIFNAPLDKDCCFEDLSALQNYLNSGFGTKYAVESDGSTPDDNKLNDNKNRYQNGTVDGNKYIGQIVSVSNISNEKEPKIYVLNIGLDNDGLFGWHCCEAHTIDEELIMNIPEGIGGIKQGFKFNEDTSIKDIFKLMFNDPIKPQCKIVIDDVEIENELLVERGSSINGKIINIEFEQNDGGLLYEIQIKNNDLVLHTINNPESNFFEYEIKDFEDINKDIELEIICKYNENDKLLKDDEIIENKKTLPKGECSKKIKVVAAYPYWCYSTQFNEKICCDNILKNNFEGLNLKNGDTLTVNVKEGDQVVVFAYPRILGDCKYINYVEMKDPQNDLVFDKRIISITDAKRNIPEILYKIDNDGDMVPEVVNGNIIINEVPSNPESYNVYYYRGSKKFNSNATFILKI